VQPPMAQPNYDYRYRPNERIFQANVTSVRAVVGAAEQRCWIERQQVVEDRGGANVPGAIIGGVLGGVLGHQIGSGRGNDVGTAAGAILGGIIGHEIEKDRRADDDLDMSRCRIVGDSSTIQGYDVRYRYQGQEYVTRLDHDPGSRLTVGGDINTDGTPYEQAAYTPNYYSYR